MWDIIYLIKDLIHTRNFQHFINNRYDYDPRRLLIDRKLLSHITLSDGTMFHVTPDIETAMDAYKDYDISNLNNDSVVLDVGANIGGFTMRIARKVKHVYAVEPMMGEHLMRNIDLNNIKNASVFDYGVGDASGAEMVWHGAKKHVEMRTLKEIIDTCEHDPDFLKIDCEGCEHSISEQDLVGIQYIEGELHNFTGNHPFSVFCDMIHSCGFEYALDVHRGGVTAIIHACRSK